MAPSLMGPPTLPTNFLPREYQSVYICVNCGILGSRNPKWKLLIWCKLLPKKKKKKIIVGLAKLVDSTLLFLVWVSNVVFTQGWG